MIDIINGVFESLGSMFISFSIIRLYKDKQVKGVSRIHVSFFTSWGFWNMYYYPQLNQWLSFIGGVLVAITNSIYTLMLLYYQYKYK